MILELYQVVPFEVHLHLAKILESGQWTIWEKLKKIHSIICSDNSLQMSQEVATSNSMKKMLSKVDNWSNPKFQIGQNIISMKTATLMGRNQWRGLQQLSRWWIKWELLLKVSVAIQDTQTLVVTMVLMVSAKEWAPLESR